MEFASARQSSTRTTVDGGKKKVRKAECAINGDENDFSATTSQRKNPHWIGTLKENTFITSIQVNGREKQYIEGFWITIKDEHDNSQYRSARHNKLNETMNEVKLEEKYASEWVEIGGVKGVIGRTVRIEIQGQSALSLGIREIKVFGVLASEMFAQANATIQNFNYTILNDEEKETENSSDEFDSSEDDSSKFSN